MILKDLKPSTWSKFRLYTISERKIYAPNINIFQQTDSQIENLDQIKFNFLLLILMEQAKKQKLKLTNWKKESRLIAI